MQHSRLSRVTAFLCLAMFSGTPCLAQSADEPVTITARFYATQGREAEAEAFLLKIVAFVRSAEPSTTIRFHRSIKDPTVFFFYEVYPTPAAREAHSKVTLPAFGKQYGRPPEGLFARPQEVEMFREFTN